MVFADLLFFEKAVISHCFREADERVWMGQGEIIDRVKRPFNPYLLAELLGLILQGGVALILKREGAQV